MLSENPIVVNFEIEGKKIMGLNGGPIYKINQSISLFFTCANNSEIEKYWNKLIDSGSAIFPLDTYPWSEKYGWVKDKFGMTWQLSLINNIENNQKIKTSFLFVNAQYGKAEEAIKFYTSIFSNSEIKELEMYGAMEDQLIGKLKFGSFYLNGESFSAMDGSGNQEFNFNEGLSIVVDCNDQKEIDYYWDKLTAGGKEGQCGWVKDKFGVSWQIVPAKLDKFMSNPEKAQRVMKVIMQSKKFNIEELENA